jgi:peptidoglycan hydrolase-like protein with peptidoglycan-binding domain
MLGPFWGQSPNIGSGGNANVVGFWQEILMASENNWSACVPEQADGVFGGNTTNGTKKFQTALGVTSDGIVGPNTWNAAELYQPPNHPPALINSGNGYFSYYTGGAASALLAYAPAWGGWFWEQGAQRAYWTTSYDVNNITQPIDHYGC